MSNYEYKGETFKLDDSKGLLCGSNLQGSNRVFWGEY